MLEKILALIEKLAETYLLTFVLLFGAGVVLLAMGATGGLPQFAIIVSDPIWRNIIGICGVILLGFALVFAFVSMKTPGRRSLDKKQIDISIDQPGDGNSVVVPCPVSGRCRKLPQGAKLWLFTIGGHGKGTRYWPQDEIEVKGESWNTELRATNFSPGDKRRFTIFAVGEDGQALIHHYRVAGEAINAIEPKRNDRPWPGLGALTSDMISATESRQVILTGKQTGR
jgi:hypothetical protein